MYIRSLPIEDTLGHLLIHNIVGEDGRKVLKKGTRITEKEIATLRESVHKQVDVGIIEDNDVHENEAARRITDALLAKSAGWRTSRAVGGRVNIHTEQNGVLKVDVQRLVAFNSLPYVTLATRRQHAPLGPSFESTRAATLKIIPYAIPNSVLEQAVALADSILQIMPLPKQRVALLITADEASAARIQGQFESATRTRIERLGSDLATVETVEQEDRQIAATAQRLLASHDALFIGGQTSIMDIEDSTPRALSMMGAEIALHGAPVEPGNLLALAYHGPKWILCAPGCAKSIKPNIVDLLLPRLMAGEQLAAADIAEMGLGGLL